MDIREELQKKIDIVNGRLSDMYEQDYANLQAVKINKEQLRKILGEDTQRRYYPNVNELTDEQVEKVTVIADKFIESDWTTEEGRNRIYEKRLSSFENNNKLDKETALKLYDIFSTDIYHEMIEKHQLDSRQFVDLVKRNMEIPASVVESSIRKLMKQGKKIKRSQSRMFLQKIFNDLRERD